MPSLLCEATLADVAEDKDVWNVLTKAELSSRKYELGEQPRLLGIFIARRFKGLDWKALASRLKGLVESSIPCKDDMCSVTAKSLTQCIAPLADRTSHSLQQVESALKMLDDEDCNELLQGCLSLPNGKLLKKETAAWLQRTQESESLSTRLRECVTRAREGLGADQSAGDKVKIFAERMAAVKRWLHLAVDLGCTLPSTLC